MGDNPPQGTGAVPGDAMSLTAAERLTVQALIINDLTPFAGADIAAILADVAGLAGAVMRGTDGAALAASWTAALATVLGNFTAVNIGYLDELDFDLQGTLATLQADIDEGKERRWKETYVYETEYEQITNAGEETVTPPTGISPTFQAGSTLRRAILVASLKANNDTAALHKIGVTLEYQIAGGGWNDLIDLTAVPVLMLPEVDGTGDAVSIVEEMTGLFTTGQLVEVRFSVDSTNAAAVNYMTTFVLSLEFDLV